MHFLWFCSPLPGRIAQRIVDFAKMNPTYRVMILVDVEPEKNEAAFLGFTSLLSDDRSI